MKKRRDREGVAASPQKNRVSAMAVAGMWIAVSALPMAAPVSAIAEIPWRSGHAATQTKTHDEIRTAIAELDSSADSRHIVVQFDRPLVRQQKAALDRSGLILLSYLGNNAYFASLPAQGVDAEAVAQTRTLIDARAIERAWKLHPAIVANEYPPYALDSADPQNPRVAAYVQFHRDVDLTTTGVKTAQRHAAEVMDHMRSVNSLVIELPLAELLALADEDVVQWIEPALPGLSEVNSDNRILTQVNTLQASPYDLDGSGVRVMVYDGGFGLSSHQDFGGRLTTRDNSGLSDHSTHVAGTIGGDGSASGGTNRGMAPAVIIESYGLQVSGGGIFLYSNPGDLESNYDDAINLYGTVITNNSIGTNTETNGFPCDIQGDYGVTSALIDAIVGGSLGTPYRIVWANGNERSGSRCNVEGFGDYYSTAPPAGAKNHIAVGALNSNSEGMTSFSSWGPVDDGRMKPDISAPGCQSNGDGGVTSTSSSGGYSNKCGTSMAAPTVTGLCALILEDYRVQFPTLADPRNATLKALLAHNAKDKGTPGPDYQFGYGMVKGQETIDFMRTGNFDEDQVSQGGVVIYESIVTASDTELKVTLAWDDVPGTPNVDPALVNDLDLVVISPSSAQTFPWTLNPADPSARARQNQANTVDNIEQVVVEAPEAGTWTIEVHGTTVPEGPQTFSICVSPGILLSGVTISLPDGPPQVTSRGVPTTVTVQIVAIGESIQASSETLHYRNGGGPFQTSTLTSVGGEFYEATLPAAGCGDTPEFYISATGSVSGLATLPADAATDVFTPLVGSIAIVLDDDLETDQGWSVGAVTDTATTGIWRRTDSIGTEAQPEDDHTAFPGVTCFVTGQGTVGGSLGENDIDGGATTLFTPTMDLSAFDDATVSYFRWFSNSTGASPNSDIFSVGISDDGGTTWTTVEVVGPTGPQVVGGWIFHEFNVAAFVTPTDQVVVRFVAADTGNGSLVEAAVDDVLVSALTCAAPCATASECDDENVCTIDTCDDGFCANTEIDCDDGLDCTADTCDRVTGCANTPVDAECDDGNVCTIGTCDTELGCLSDGTGVVDPCDDGDACTTLDLCQGDGAGTCVGTFADGDGDGVCDADDICPGGDDADDADGDSVPDFCDLCPDGDDTIDTNGNGIPDECETHAPLPAAAPHDRKKNRYLSMDPNNTDIAVALKVTMTAAFNHPDALGTAMWVGEPDADGLAVLSATPVIRLWPEAAVHVTGCFVSPVATYDVQAMIVEGALPTDPLSIDTIDQPAGGKFWGDTVGSFTGTEWTPPQGVTNIDDAVAVIKNWQAEPGAPHASVADVEPQFINRVVNFNDVLFVIFAFQGDPYPFGCPADPCQDNRVTPCP